VLDRCMNISSPWIVRVDRQSFRQTAVAINYYFARSYIGRVPSPTEISRPRCPLAKLGEMTRSDEQFAQTLRDHVEQADRDDDDDHDGAGLGEVEAADHLPQHDSDT